MLHPWPTPCASTLHASHTLCPAPLNLLPLAGLSNTCAFIARSWRSKACRKGMQQKSEEWGTGSGFRAGSVGGAATLVIPCCSLTLPRRSLTLTLALGPHKWDRSRIGPSSSGAFSFVAHSPTHTSASGCATKLACTFIQLCAGPQRPPPSQPACALWPCSCPCRKSAGDKPQQATGSVAETTQVRNSAGALQGDGALH